MGTFSVELQIGDPAGTTFETIEALVDTEASYTTLPSSVLRRLGVEPDERASFDLADGRTVEYGIGETKVRINGRQRTTMVVFGDEDSQPLLGAVTLEQFGLGVDPLRRQLVPVPRLLM